MIESTIEEEKKNLYQIIKKMREEENEPIARLFYAASLSEPEKGESNFSIEEKISNWVKTSTEINKEILTGYMQINGINFVHLIEGNSQILNLFLLFLYNELNKPNSIFKVIHIILFNEENPERFFNQFLIDYGSQFRAPHIEFDKTEQQISERSWEIYLKFYEAGKKSKQNHSSVNLVNEIALTDEDLCMFIQGKYMSINEYKDFYLEDPEINLDNEHIFPYTPSVLANLEYSDMGNLTDLI